jgi:protein-S-isoprenylcysteine O-methyltransferase Ste14
MRSLRTRITLNTAKFLLALAVVLFASAGTLRYWEAWVYLGLQLASMAAINVYLLKRDPALLERRLALDEHGEKEKVQRVVMGLFRLFGLAMLIVAGVDHRLGWSAVPPVLVAAAAAVFAAGVLLVFMVFRENTYTSSVIEVNAGQTVVSTGPYRLVRHPMYAGMLIMGLATPLLLGSYWAALFLLPGWVLLGIRILAEERFLSERLSGYKEYMTATRHRLIPGVW